MTGYEQTDGQWCHCGGWWLTLDQEWPVYDAGHLHDRYHCGGVA